MAVLVLPSFAQSSSTSTVGRPEGTSLRVANYNIFFGSVFPQDNGQPPLPGKRRIKDRTGQFLRIHQAIMPDIWALQEVLYSGEEKKTKTVAGMQKHFNQATGENWHVAADEKGRLLFSRFPIKWHKEITTRVHGVLIDVPESVSKQDLLLLNLHLSPGNADERLRSAKNAVEFLDQVDQGKVPEVSRDVPIIICGDFNSLPTAPPYRVLQSLDPDVPEQGKLNVVFEDPHPKQFGAGNDATYGSVIFGDDQRTIDAKRIDFLLFRSDSLTVTNSYVLNTLTLDQETLQKHKLNRSDVALNPQQELNGKVSFDHLPMVVDFAADTDK